MNIDDNPFYGHMPYSNLHDENTVEGAKCCINLTADCIHAKCMAWRWMRHEDGELYSSTDDDGVEVNSGWCGLVAFPAIGQKAF